MCESEAMCVRERERESGGEGEREIERAAERELEWKKERTSRLFSWFAFIICSCLSAFLIKTIHTIGVIHAE